MVRCGRYLFWLPIWPAAARAQDTLWATCHEAERLSARRKPAGWGTVVYLW